MIMYVPSTADVSANLTGGCGTITKVKGLISEGQETHEAHQHGSKNFLFQHDMSGLYPYVVVRKSSGPANTRSIVVMYLSQSAARPLRRAFRLPIYVVLPPRSKVGDLH